MDTRLASVAAILAFLLWAYLSGLIFLFGAFLIVAYYRLNLQRADEKSLSEQTRGIGMADNIPQAPLQRELHLPAAD